MIQFSKHQKKRIGNRVTDICEKLATAALIAGYVQESEYLVCLGILLVFYCIFYEYIGDEND